MICQPVTLRFTPTVSAALEPGRWAVTAAVDDPREEVDGWAVAVGDVVFLDLRGSTSAPGTVGRYVVTALISRSSSSVSVSLAWAAVGGAIDPAEAVSVRGYLTRPVDASGAVIHPAQETLLIEQEVIDLAREVELLEVGDESTEAEQVRTYAAAELIAAGRMVHLLSSGSVVVADPSDASRMPAIGQAITGGTDRVRVRIGGEAAGFSIGLTSGHPVFVGAGGLPTTDASTVPVPGVVQMVGVALDARSIGLCVTGSMLKRL